MQARAKGIRRTVVGLLVLMGLALGLFISQYVHLGSPLNGPDFHGTWLHKPRDVGQFDLMGTDQEAFTNASLKQRWTMLFFGFTSCSSICPTTMAELAKMYRSLEGKDVQPLPQVVMISLDPERDSMEKLNEYVTAFDPSFIGARETKEGAVKALATELGVAYEKMTTADAKEGQQPYNIEHSGTVMLFNPEGKLCAFFTMPHKASLLAKDYQLILKTVGAKG